MNSPVAFILVASLVVLLAQAAPPKETYSTKFDNIDVDAILKNERALSQYVQCMLDKGPCSPEGREFRKNLPDALKTNCSKCSDAQKTLIRKLTKHLIDHRASDWALIKTKFDPKGEHHDAFVKFLAGN